MNKDQTDPFAEREAGKYSNPIPSREYIIELLNKLQKPLQTNHLQELLKLETADAQEALRRRLRAMQRDNQLERLRDGYFWPQGQRLSFQGVVNFIEDAVFVQSPEYPEPIPLLNRNEILELKDTDRVIVSIINAQSEGPLDAKLVEILDRKPKQVIGRYIASQNAPFVVPHSREFPEDILIKDELPKGLKDGDIVVVSLKSFDPSYSGPVGRIAQILGHENTPGIEITAALKAFDVPHVWPEALEDECRDIESEVKPAHKRGRFDVRHLPLVTIDGEDARDFDDAVYCEPMRGGSWRLLVAIADVSHYVKPGTALDLEAQNRGNSVYFPGQVVPMLPEILSNELCSLKPEVDRLCMIAELRISANGNLSRYAFHEGLMRSHARLTYNKVALILKDNPSLTQDYAPLVPHIKNLQALYHLLHQARKQRGAIDFETTETRIIFNEAGKLARIEPVTRNEAHKIIEECMLCANVATAKFLKKHKVPALYRNHEGPSADKLADLLKFLQEMGLKFQSKKGNPEPLDYARLLKSIQSRPDANVIQLVLLRSLTQAVYSPDNLGHFGLAFAAYCHFTSPIRRYPDLLVHRQIRSILRQKPSQDAEKTLKKQAKMAAELEVLGAHCSMSERRADDATRDVTRWLKCEYIKKHIGSDYDGVISGVTRFGFFVELKDIFIDGLVHISNIGGDYYHFDATHHRLLGEHTGRSYKLGDTIRVKVTRVDCDHRRIDFGLLDPAQAGKTPDAKSSKKSSKANAPISAHSDEPKKKRKRRRTHKTKK